MVSRAVALGLITVSLTVVGCGKKTEAPAKSADQISAEKSAEDKRVADAVRANPVYGEKIKALDTAKEMQKSLDAQAAESAKKLDELTK